MRVLGIINQKGGVGKTTTTYHIATALSQNLRVLAIDLDPKGGLTMVATEKDPDEYEMTIAEVLMGEISLSEIITPIRNNLDLVPANIYLSKVEVQLIDKLQRELRLKKALREVISNYDIAIIDTPPSLGLLTINALFASDAIIIPVEAKLMGLRGLAILQDVLTDIRNSVDDFNLQVLGILPTFYDKRTTLAKEVMEELKEVFGEHVSIFPPIKTTIKLAETPAVHAPVHERAETKNSDVAQAYLEVAKEVEKWVRS